jgi:hypothetical protein
MAAEPPCGPRLLCCSRSLHQDFPDGAANLARFQYASKHACAQPSRFDLVATNHLQMEQTELYSCSSLKTAALPCSSDAPL